MSNPFDPLIPTSILTLETRVLNLETKIFHLSRKMQKLINTYELCLKLFIDIDEQEDNSMDSDSII